MNDFELGIGSFRISPNSRFPCLYLMRNGLLLAKTCKCSINDEDEDEPN